MFSKVKRSFLNNDPKHKHAYALLSVITDKIREQGGDENNNASYFAMLMNYLNEFVSEKTKTDDNKDMEMLAGVILLLSETVPKVPGDVLSKHGKNCIEKLTLALKMLNECPGLGSAVSQRCILSLGCLLRENFEVYQTTTEAILEVAFNGNPKSRRIACNACYQCIGRHRGLKDNEPHPLSRLVVKKCIEHIKSVGLTHKCVAAFNVLRAIFRAVAAKKYHSRHEKGPPLVYFCQRSICFFVLGSYLGDFTKFSKSIPGIPGIPGRLRRPCWRC